MNAISAPAAETNRYARCIEASKRIRWDIDKDVFRGRSFDFTTKFLPDGLSRINRLAGMSENEKRLLSQIQGRTYAYIFGLVERFINAKVLEISREHWTGDQVALEALVRFSDEELKHQAMFRRIESMISEQMPAGYECTADPDLVAKAVLARSTWSVLGLTCHIELFTQAHYKLSIEPEENLSPLFKDVFLYHWREESQHAILDEMEWEREHARLSTAERDSAVDDLIALVGAVDGILRAQASADAKYFCSILERRVSAEEQSGIEASTLAAYRWQYIVSGVQEPRFAEILQRMTTPAQMQRIGSALSPILQSAA